MSSPLLALTFLLGLLLFVAPFQVRHCALLLLVLPHVFRAFYERQKVTRFGSKWNRGSKTCKNRFVGSLDCHVAGINAHLLQAETLLMHLLPRHTSQLVFSRGLDTHHYVRKVANKKHIGG